MTGHPLPGSAWVRVDHVLDWLRGDLSMQELLRPSPATGVDSVAGDSLTLEVLAQQFEGMVASTEIPSLRLEVTDA